MNATNHTNPQARTQRKPKDEAARERTREHTRTMFEFLNQVKRDGDPGAFMVAYEIAEHVNEVTGIAFPGNRRIAENLGLAESTCGRPWTGWNAAGISSLSEASAGAAIRAAIGSS